MAANASKRPTGEEMAETFGGRERLYGSASEPVPNDTYVMEIVKAEARQGQNGLQNWYVNVDHRIIEGEKTGDEYEGRHVFDILPLGLTKLNDDGEEVESQAQNMTVARLDQIFGDDGLPDEIAGISPYEQEELAHIIAEAIVGQTYQAYVMTEKLTDQQKEEGRTPRNRVALPRAS